MGFGKLGENGHWVIANSKERDSAAFEIRQRALQLDELRLAEGSPTGTAVKEHNGAPPGAGLMEINGVTVLVRQRYIRELLADGWSDVGKIYSGRHSSFPFLIHSL